jgi:hypothetical protein
MTTHPLPMLVAALRKSGERQTAAAVQEYARLARLVIPTQGLILIDDEDAAIETIAQRHFRLHTVRRDVTRHLHAAVGSFSRRDPIESAITELVDATDRAHYYYGLATGLVASSLNMRRAK